VKTRTMNKKKRAEQIGSARMAVAVSACLVFAASGKVVADVFIVPSISVAVIHDDNVFVTAGPREEDTITQVSPALEAGYEGETFNARMNYGREMEKYNEFDELDSNSMREYLDLMMDYAVSPRLSLSLVGDYIESRVPADLNPVIGLGAGRTQGQRSSVTAGFEYRLTETLTGVMDYTDAREELSDGIGNEIHTVDASFEHDINARNQLIYGFRYSEYEFDNGFTQEVKVPRVGLLHALNDRTSIRLEAGPLKAGDEKEVYFNALLTRTHDRGNFTVGINRDVNTVIGEAGIVEADSFNVGLLHRLGDDLQISASAGYGKVTRSDRELDEADVIRAAVEARYSVNNAVILFATYNYSKQEAPRIAGQSFEIPRHEVSVGVTFRIPHRSSQNR